MITGKWENIIKPEEVAIIEDVEEDGKKEQDL